MKDARGHGSDAKTIAAQHGISTAHLSPRFADYAAAQFGGKYMIARPTANNKFRYPDHRFITPKQHEAVKAAYRREHPEAAKEYFGE